MLSHQPGDKNDALRMNARVKQISEQLIQMTGINESNSEKETDSNEGKLTIIS